MAANSYSNRGIYIHIFVGTVIPESWKTQFLDMTGEGLNWIELSDGSKLVKNCFLGEVGINIIREIVHAEDNNKCALIDVAEARELANTTGVV
ncbi:hypothetical protein CMI37_35775 [Candidatus Pacearchaeota archaeon]|nr:hypothetical protein [Candidatus Pacearchaeota archaeon]|tara:strand:+ start:1273 stop:1551 length:279 start_codon:yes stop_codon:yes gene_type:complete